MKNQLKVAAGALMLALAGQAVAATNWLTSSTNPGSITMGTVTVTPQGWAGINGGTLVQQVGTGSSTTSHFGSYSGGGLGINNSIDGEVYGAQPDHAIDNFGANEMVLLSFTKAVNLTSLSMGYVSGDADFTVMAFNVNGAAGAPNLGLDKSGTGGVNNSSWNALKATSSGWTLIGDYQNSSKSATVNNVLQNDKNFANNYYSSYWLIGAYNPLVGVMSGFSADNTLDYFKLASVSGTVCTANSGNCGTTSKVPEPGSLALVGLGLMGMIRIRKARKV